MSASFSVDSSTGSYEVSVRAGLFAETQWAGGRVIADEFFREPPSWLNEQTIFVEATETAKSLDRAPALIEQLRAGGTTRQTRLLSLGGGIIQDLSAFVASIYMRGLEWDYMPSTVLAMVDSCIGGKSSINVGPYKNLVGTFHPPQRVLVDPVLANTLPDDHKASGLIEAAKICFCKGEESFARHLSYGPSVTMSTEALEKVIVNSLQSKKWFIEIDEFDRKERLLLNFGHTFGHAIEGATHFAVSHGIAVGLGIMCAIEFERQRGVNYDGLPQVKRLEEHLHAMIGEVADLARPVSAMDVEDVMERFRSDKKHGAGHFTLILINESGDVVLRKIDRSTEVARDLGRAIQTIAARYS